MDWAGGRESINLFLKKYKWALAVLMAGLVLMMIPSEETKETEKTASANHRMQEVTFEQELENILSVLEGAGKVKVLGYHGFAGGKYAALDLPDTLPNVRVTPEDVERAAACLRRYGLHAVNGMRED